MCAKEYVRGILLNSVCQKDGFYIFSAQPTEDPAMEMSFCEFPFLFFFIPRHMIVAGFYGFTLDVPVSVHPSVVNSFVHILFPNDNLSEHQWIFTKLVCALILWRSGLGLVKGKFRQILTEICPRHTHIFVSG